jgi:hypothetical protein
VFCRNGVAHPDAFISLLVHALLAARDSPMVLRGKILYGNPETL